MKIWLDDLRPAPKGWLWCKSVTEAQIALRSGAVENLSLDHDLGNQDDGDGIKLVLWLCEAEKFWPRSRPTVHSRNPVGRENMLALIQRYGPYEE